MKKIIIWNFILILSVANTRLRFTNIRCTPLDTDFADFEYCFLKAVNRTYSYVSLKVKLFKVPVTNGSVQVSLLKRANGYKPFLYNQTADICKFMKNQNRSPVFKYLFNLFIRHTNVNHPCPLNHDVIVEKLSSQFVNERMTDMLPFPRGEYAVDTNWFAYNKNRANVIVFVELT